VVDRSRDSDKSKSKDSDNDKSKVADRHNFIGNEDAVDELVFRGNIEDHIINITGDGAAVISYTDDILGLVTVAVTSVERLVFGDGTTVSVVSPASTTALSFGGITALTATRSDTISTLTAHEDVAAGTSSTASVTVGSSYSGTIDSDGDRDWVAVSLTGGTAYQVDLAGSPTNAGTLSDPYLRGIYDSGGNFISGTDNDDGSDNLNSQVTFTPSSTGTYYISAGAYSSNTGTYSLSVSQASSGDVAASTSTTATVSSGGSYSGTIDSSEDQDWVAVALTAGNTYRIDLEGSPTNAGTLSDPFLRGVYGSIGTLFSGTTNDDGGTGLNSQVTFTATTTGTHYISAGAYFSSTGTYSLSVAQTDSVTTSSSDGVPADTSTSATVSVGGSYSGSIDSTDDQDWVAVTLSGGSSYQIDLEGSSTNAGTLSDPFFRGVYDSAGNFIFGTADDDGGTGLNSQLTFTASSDGTPTSLRQAPIAAIQEPIASPLRRRTAPLRHRRMSPLAHRHPPQSLSAQAIAASSIAVRIGTGLRFH
jgi:hypothetical protein